MYIRRDLRVGVLLEEIFSIFQIHPREGWGHTHKRFPCKLIQCIDELPYRDAVKIHLPLRELLNYLIQDIQDYCTPRHHSKVHQQLFEVGEPNHSYWSNVEDMLMTEQKAMLLM